jgi:hypothetical protein
MGRDSLAGEDAAWLHMERATNPMVVNGIVELEEELSASDVIRMLERLVQTSPRFRSRVLEPRARVGAPHWQLDKDFELEWHLERVQLAPGDEAALRAFISGAISTQLELTRPPWRVHVIDRAGHGTTLLFRVHHAIGDGFALLAVLQSLCDEGDTGATLPAHAPVHHEHHALEYAVALERLVALPPDSLTILKRPLGGGKRVAWTEPVALDDVKRIAHTAGATVNDVLVAAVAGALRRYLARRGEDVRGLEVRAMMPVNLRDAASAKALGNHFGLVVVELPVGVPESLLRVDVVKHEMDELKKSPEAAVAFGLLGAMGYMPREVERVGVAFFGQKASVVLTNVPGPRQALHLAGIRIARVVFWVPQSAQLGLGVSIFSYAGEITIGVMADANVLADPDVLVADVHVELAALSAEVRNRAQHQAESATHPHASP